MSGAGQTPAVSAAVMAVVPFMNNTSVDTAASPDDIYQHESDAAPPGVVITDRMSTILAVDPSAAELLNVGARGSRLRHLTNFFTTGRRELILKMQHVHVGDQPVELRHTLRPRERRPVDVIVRLSAAGANVRWELQRLGAD
jgi:hypothetical protein